MSPKLSRQYLIDGTFVDISIDEIRADSFRPHGVKYRFAWIENGKCRVLFDNHPGKKDRFHIDDVEQDYQFESVEKLYDDFSAEIRKLGGLI